jgi:hypothetical protein
VAGLALIIVLSSKFGMIAPISGMLRGKNPYLCDITSMLRDNSTQQPSRSFLIKVARSDHFDNETSTLRLLWGHKSFRQLVDVIDDQPIMVLEYLPGNVQRTVNMRPKRRLEIWEARSVAKVMLEGLSTLHEMNRAHTGTMWDSRGETTEFY